MNRAGISLLVFLAWLTMLPLSGAASRSAPDDAAAPSPVLVYEVRRDAVVLAISNKAEIRQAAAGWLEQAGGLSGKFRVGTDSGIVIRIPFVPLLPVRLYDLTFQCKELLVLVPEISSPKQNPQLLAFSAEDRLYVFDCSYPALRPFLEKHGLLRFLSSPEAKVQPSFLGPSIPPKARPYPSQS
ncbi:hypothetical protein [Paenibacillus sp. A3]|uniref:hypothetical protein n=1 Tax=Paenibacillus sp. A3 TaxID=1337054 RepID=UPI0006D58B53|nr:hypothetical protein [Paenibacillus sp. A3]